MQEVEEKRNLVLVSIKGVILVYPASCAMMQYRSEVHFNKRAIYNRAIEWGCTTDTYIFTSMEPEPFSKYSQVPNT